MFDYNELVRVANNLDGGFSVLDDIKGKMSTFDTIEKALAYRRMVVLYYEDLAK